MSRQQLHINGHRLWESIISMAEIGPGEHGGSCRLALTDVDKDGRNLFFRWCEEIGRSITIDDMGNIFARRDGRNNSLLPIVSGNHLDTQPYGGKFDGIYGVLAALEVLGAYMKKMWSQKPLLKWLYGSMKKDPDLRQPWLRLASMQVY